jgi:hypothetical protein
MITGKNSAQLGFMWFFLGILKIMTSIAALAHWKQYPFVGVIGIIALLAFSYEQIKEYKRLSK